MQADGSEVTASLELMPFDDHVAADFFGGSDPALDAALTHER